MGTLRELSDMSRDYGLGGRYFVLVTAILAVLLACLTVWGRIEDPSDRPPAQTDSESAAPSPSAPSQ